MKNILIGFDFSISKPAACVKIDNKYLFYAWPYNLQKKIIPIYENSRVNISNRTHEKDKGPDVSSKMRYEVRDARRLSEMISDTLKPYLNRNTYIAFEGMSYGSSGDVVLQLGGYKYLIMDELSKYVPLDNMFTYSPITIKKTAGCSKKGTPKSEVIESFIRNSYPTPLRESLKKDRLSFRKKGDKNFIDLLDDLVDSYWVLETLRDKENLL